MNKRLMINKSLEYRMEERELNKGSYKVNLEYDSKSKKYIVTRTSKNTKYQEKTKDVYHAIGIFNLFTKNRNIIDKALQIYR